MSLSLRSFSIWIVISGLFLAACSNSNPPPTTPSVRITSTPNPLATKPQAPIETATLTPLAGETILPSPSALATVTSAEIQTEPPQPTATPIRASGSKATATNSTSPTNTPAPGSGELGGPASTNTALPPAKTSAPPTNTMPPANTAVPPTKTFSPPTNTAIPPSQTPANTAPPTPVPPTDTPVPANTTDPALEIDNDQDGFTPLQGDCDDNDPFVNPGQPERLNGADDNCNGQVNEGFEAPAIPRRRGLPGSGAEHETRRTRVY